MFPFRQQKCGNEYLNKSMKCILSNKHMVSNDRHGKITKFFYGNNLCNLSLSLYCTREKNRKNSDRAPGNISDGIPTVSVTNRKTNDEATVYPASKEGKGVLECTTSNNIEVIDGPGRKQIGGQVKVKGNTGFITKTIESGEGFIAVSKTSGVRQPVGKASVDSRRSQQSLEQQPKQPVGLCSNILAITGSNRGDDTEDEASDTDSIHDPHSVEENQLLITGFANCMENKMATLKSASASEASTSAKDSYKETSSLPRGNPLSPFTKQAGKKKGKKLKLAKGQ
ncbi:hypothetical protein D5086_027665 [Populus alba]|uniref:Uncharacterized protein n=1 Tax=Populus alba TaxID=43335 RepID=A0ACC4AW43_POPAL